MLNAACAYAERYITPLVTMRRTRTLPFPGRVLRRVGDRLAADSVVAETDNPGGYRLIELDRVLRTRVRDARAVMVKRVGDPVEEGEVIARAGVLWRREYASPVAGQIVDMHENKVLIRATPEHVELTAFYPGLVVELIPDMGVVIEATGALIQGAWGTGAALRATLRSAVPGGDVPLEAEQIAADHVGVILIGGRTIDAEGIARAIECGVRALIVGSVRSDLLPALKGSPLSLILSEGFGDLAMSPRTFELLRSYAGQEVCFEPATRVTWETQRPEVFCYVPTEGRPPLAKPGTSLSVGTRVRALGVPYHGAVGEIVSLPIHPHRLESGIRAWGAQVDLGSVGKVFLPLENLEIVR